MNRQWLRSSAVCVLCVIFAGCGSAAGVPVASSVAPLAPATAPTRSSATAATGQCTNPQMPAQAVIERYFQLSTSKNAQAVIDCSAKVWRDKHNANPTFAESAASWPKAGPASGVVITFIDAVNGCDRFSVSAQMATYGTNNAFSVPPFFTVGPEGGTPRIFETGTALVNTQIATTTCK